MSEKQVIQRLEQELDDLKRNAPQDRAHIAKTLNEIAWHLSDIHADRAYSLGEEAFTLASESCDNRPPLQSDVAHSLRTLGYINQRLGKHQLGLGQLLQALALCEAHAISDLLPDVLDGIAGIYAQIGDYPTALGYIQRQLAAAQQIDDKRLISNALNNLAALYWQTRERERAVETLQQNLQLAREIGFDRITAITLINLAEVHEDAGEIELAREYLQEGLRVSQTAGFIIFELYAYLVAGAIERRAGAENAALTLLNHALALSRSENAQGVEVHILMTLGELHLDQHRFDLALATLRQALAIATAIDAKDAMYNAHQRLADGYEKQGDVAQALVHLKQYQALKEVVAGEKAEQRLQVLQIAHDTATARQEAENARLRSAELSTLNAQLEQQVAIRTAELTATVAQLQTEIAMRTQAQAEIRQLVDTLEQRVAARTDELVTFFDLTLLAGQVTDLHDVFAQVMPRIMEVTRSRALCIHLFDAAHTALAIAGQQNLPEDAAARLHTAPLTAGFARWMQQANDPLVTTDLAALALLPPAFRLAGYQTYLGAQIKIGSQVMGLLSCYRFTNRGYGLDEIALVTALAEQLGLMLETQRLRQRALDIAVVEERQRLARDLHDSVTQSLYSLTLFSRAGREAAEDGDASRLAYSLAELERNTLHALREMRLLLYELRPADLEQEGLTRAIQLRLDTVERRVGLRLDVHLEELPALSPRAEVELYHVIVEGLNNVVKHAAASRLSVLLEEMDSQMHLRIVDDGKGFDMAQRTGGLGLRNMRERVARLHGQLAIASAPGRGTQVDAVIPYPAETRQWPS
jgi:signal transduction histidine kinase